MLQYKTLCLLLTTTQTSRRLCLLLEGCPKKSFSVVVSWRTSFHIKNRLAEKSFSVVGRQQAAGLVETNVCAFDFTMGIWYDFTSKSDVSML